jgi:hypothetical protein
MRILILIILVCSLSACYALRNPNGAIQPVEYKNGQDNILFTTCSGAVEDWGNCNSKAQNSCPKGYDVVERAESPVGGKRELTFRCK